MQGSAVWRVTRRLVFWVAGSLLAFLIFSALVTLPMGGDNVNLVGAFNVDEAGAINHLTRNLYDHNLDPHGFYFHGRVYQTINYALVRVYSQLGFQVLDRTIVYIARLLSLSAYLLLLVCCYRIMRRLRNDPAVSMLAALTVGAIPDLYYYAQVIHPDTLQVALMAWAVLLICVPGADAPRAIVASAVCGVGCATKFNAAFLLPFLPLPSFLHWTASDEPSVARLSARLVGLWLVCAAVFLIAFFLWSPYAWRDFPAFWASMQELRRVVGTGFQKNEPANPLLWAPVIVGQFGWTQIVLLGAGMIALAAKAIAWAAPLASWRQRLRRLAGALHARIVIALGAYVVIAGVLLLATVRWREPRYSLHLLPFAVIVGFCGLQAILRRLPPGIRSIGIVALTIVALSHGVSSLAVLAPFANRPVAPVVLAGEWIAANFSRDTAVVADWYTYQPPTFTHYRIDYVATRLDELYASDEYELLLLTKDGIGRYIWKQPTSRLAERKWKIDRTFSQTDAIVQAIDRFLAAGSVWKLVYENDDVVIFQRQH